MAGGGLWPGGDLADGRDHGLAAPCRSTVRRALQLAAPGCHESRSAHRLALLPALTSSGCSMPSRFAFRADRCRLRRPRWIRRIQQRLRDGAGDRVLRTFAQALARIEGSMAIRDGGDGSSFWARRPASVCRTASAVFVRSGRSSRRDVRPWRRRPAGADRDHDRRQDRRRAQRAGRRISSLRGSARRRRHGRAVDLGTILAGS